MKKLLLVITFIFCGIANAQFLKTGTGRIIANVASDSSVTTSHTYYVTSGGSNSNNGLTKVNAVQTIQYAVSLATHHGDSILIRNGVAYRDQKIIPTTDSLYFGTYGTGSDTGTLNGAHILSSWTDLGSHIYRTTYTGGDSSNNLPKLLIIDGVNYSMGRWPRESSNDHRGYLAVTAVTSTTITANLTGAPTSNWAGAFISQKIGYAVYNHTRVTSSSGNVITVPGVTVDATTGEIFFFNHISTCTQHGDWMIDTTTHYLYVYLDTAPSNYVIEAGYEENLVILNNLNHITFNGIKFKYAARNAFDISQCTYITINNSSICMSGKYGVKYSYPLSNHISINNSYFYRNQSTDIAAPFYFGYNWSYIMPAFSYANFDTNYFNNVAPFAAMSGLGTYEIHKAGVWDITDESEIFNRHNIVIGTNNTHDVNILNNIMIGTPYQCIRFSGDNYLIDGNYFKGKDSSNAFDFGLGYTWNVDYAGIDRHNNVNRVISNNVFEQSLGIPAYGLTASMLFYSDDHSDHVDLLDNTFIYANGFGTNLHNSDSINIKRNIYYKTSNQNEGGGYVNTTGQLQAGHDFVDGQKVRKVEVDSNIVVNVTDTLHSVFMTLSDVRDVGGEILFDSMCNFIGNKLYKISIDANGDMFQTIRPDSIRYTLYYTPDAWNTFLGYDTQSTVITFTLSDLLVFKNPTNSPVVQSISGSYFDIRTGVVYTTTITIPARSARLLLPYIP